METVTIGGQRITVCTADAVTYSMFDARTFRGPACAPLPHMLQDQSISFEYRTKIKYTQIQIILSAFQLLHFTSRNKLCLYRAIYSREHE